MKRIVKPPHLCLIYLLSPGKIQQLKRREGTCAQLGITPGSILLKRKGSDASVKRLLWHILTVTLSTSCKTISSRSSQTESVSSLWSAAGQLVCSVSSASSWLLRGGQSPTLGDAWEQLQPGIMHGKYMKVKKFRLHTSTPRQPQRLVKSRVQLQQHAAASAGRAGSAPGAKRSAATSNYTLAPSASNVLRMSAFKPPSFDVYVDWLWASVSVELTHSQPSNARRARQRRGKPKAVTTAGTGAHQEAWGASAAHHSPQTAVRINTLEPWIHIHLP